MDIYLILVMLILPGKDAPRQELHRGFIKASSFFTCQAHADKVADELRKLNEEVMTKNGAKVIARCYAQVASA
jgi:hypothetical protein